MTKILLHPATRHDIDSFVLKPSHALLICGLEGSGKRTVADFVAAAVLDIEPQKLISYPYYHEITSKGSIGIEQIRGLQALLHLKTVGKRAIRRVIIVEEAQAMTAEAQNALLKSLEEPPKDTLIVLLATRSQLLLPTVVSRTTQITIKTPSKDAASEFFSIAGDEFERAFVLSDGRIGLLKALLTDVSEHVLRKAIDDAKVLLQQSSYERLLSVNQLVTDKDALSRLLAALKQTAVAAMKRAQHEKDVMRWYRVLSQSHRAEQLLESSANSKLVLTELMLNL